MSVRGIVSGHISADRSRLQIDRHGKCAVVLSWTLTDGRRTSLLDWLAMYLLGEADPFNYLDSRAHDAHAMHHGTIKWIIRKRLFRERGISSQDVRVCFKYFDGVTGAVRAVSGPVFINLLSPNARSLSTAGNRKDRRVTDDNGNDIAGDTYSLTSNNQTPMNERVRRVDQLLLTDMTITACDTLKTHVDYYVRVTAPSNTQRTQRSRAEHNGLAFQACNLVFDADRSAEMQVEVRETHQLLGARTAAQAHIDMGHLSRCPETRRHAMILRKSDGTYFAELTLVVTPVSNPVEVENNNVQTDDNNNDQPMPSQCVVQHSLDARHTSSSIATTSAHSQSTDQLSTAPVRCSLPTPQNNSSDSGISQCSAQGSSDMSTPSPTPQSLQQSKNALGIQSPRVTRAPKLTLNSDGDVSIDQQLKQIGVEHLPPNWEARIDNYGRVFYVNHQSKTTSWRKPQCDTESPHDDRRLALQRRYACTRRTVGTAVGSDSTHDHLLHSQQAIGAWPGALFMQRVDFIALVHSSREASAMYCNSSTLRQIIQRIRKSDDKFEMYMHNVELVKLINLFADQSAPLPTNWQQCASNNAETMPIFVDHGQRRTTLIDPRLPIYTPLHTINQRRRRARSMPHNDSDDADSYHERCVRLLRRRDFPELVRQRAPQLANDSRVQNKLESIRRQGAVALLRLANDVQICAILSLFEADILRADEESEHRAESSSRTRNESAFESRLRSFNERLETLGYGQGTTKFKLSLSRSHLLTDAYSQLMAADKNVLRSARLCVRFDDEDGLDYGGPSREFFFLLSRELFNPYYGLFEYSAADAYTVQISAMSVFVDRHLDWFHFCGRILALALIHRYLIDAFFTRAFYKSLLRRPWSLTDVESLDGAFHQSLKWIVDNNVDECDLNLTFSVTEDVAGQIVERDLIADGRHRSVTEKNKHQYVQLMCRRRLERGVKAQTDALQSGFFELVDRSVLGAFDAQELELLLCGTVEIDLSDWRQNTEYKGGYTDSHVVIDWFWKCVQDMSNAQRLLLLQFVTGTSSIPHDGFSALRGAHGPRKFTIERCGAPDALPRAHTCFNRLDLPSYAECRVLREKLLLAIQETGSYAIE